MKKVLEGLRLSVWTADTAWRILTFLIVIGGGTTAGVLASTTVLFRALGPLAWLGVGLACSLLISLIIYLFRAAQLAAAQAALATAFASRPSYVNPLLTSFAELIIPMATLHLPREQLHQRKQFRRCKFVGPGALTLLGGTIVRCSFKESGHVLTVPDHTMLTGVTVFEGCTIEDCEFIAVTIIIPRSMASQLAEGIPGVQIAY
ncbi:MAG: hypothetical protein ACLQPD_01730 [Desulfomonilaceae bacterium]